MPKYWVVGATWASDDMKDKFYQLGIWEMGWDDQDKPKLAEKRDSIQEGDRIAIKTMDGQGQSTITIHAIGIVKGNDDKKIHINWILKDLNRKVPSKNCFGTIHGPYDGNDEWTRQVFSL